jgi:hypothetical protein
VTGDLTHAFKIHIATELARFVAVHGYLRMIVVTLYTNPITLYFFLFLLSTYGRELYLSQGGQTP